MHFLLLNVLRLIPALLAGILNGISITYWVRVRRKKKREKISFPTFLKLREHLRNHPDERVVVEFRLAQEKVIGGVDAFDVKIPHEIADWTAPTSHCIYVKQHILSGYYCYDEREDGLLFTLLEGKIIKNPMFAHSSEIAKRKPTAFAFVIRLPEKDQRIEMLMREGQHCAITDTWLKFFSWPRVWPPFR
jgi:hypothetical protein